MGCDRTYKTMATKYSYIARLNQQDLSQLLKNYDFLAYEFVHRAEHYKDDKKVFLEKHIFKKIEYLRFLDNSHQHVKPNMTMDEIREQQENDFANMYLKCLLLFNFKTMMCDVGRKIQVFNAPAKRLFVVLEGEVKIIYKIKDSKSIRQWFAEIQKDHRA